MRLNGLSEGTRAAAVNDIMSEPEGTHLVLDAAMSRVYAGLWRRGEWRALEGAAAPAAETLFAGVGRCLESAGMTLGDLSGFFFCEGPGSVLGTRIAATAIRTWSVYHPGRRIPCRAFRSLEVLAAALLERGETPPFGVVSDARRGHWNLLRVEAGGSFAPLRRVPDAAVEGSGIPLWLSDGGPPARRLARNRQSIPYDLDSAAPWFLRYPLLRQVDVPEPLVLRAPEYRKWSVR